MLNIPPCSAAASTDTNPKFQGITYILIIKESGEPLSDVAYSVVSVTAAMYLLVTTASPDLTVGYSLLVNGSSPKFRVFGAALLVVFGLMVTAAMRLLFSGSEDNANVVADSVTVLFIADLVSGLGSRRLLF